MQCELGILAASAGLGLVQIVLTATAGSKQRGVDWNVGPRDEAIPLTGVAGRLERAQNNFFETFPIFAALILVAYLGGKLSNLTVYGSAAYFIGRVLYIPLYAMGVKLVRTLVWGVSLIGILMIAVALFK